MTTQGGRARADDEGPHARSGRATGTGVPAGGPPPEGRKLLETAWPAAGSATMTGPARTPGRGRVRRAGLEARWFRVREPWCLVSSERRSARWQGAGVFE